MKPNQNSRHFGPYEPKRPLGPSPKDQLLREYAHAYALLLVFIVPIAALLCYVVPFLQLTGSPIWQIAKFILVCAAVNVVLTYIAIAVVALVIRSKYFFHS